MHTVIYSSDSGYREIACGFTEETEGVQFFPSQEKALAFVKENAEYFFDMQDIQIVKVVCNVEVREETTYHVHVD